MATLKHTHRYEKIDGTWYCGHPHCSHYVPRNIRGGDVKGRASMCWECGREFILIEALMQRNKPLCKECYMQTDEYKEIMRKSDEENERIMAEYRAREAQK